MVKEVNTALRGISGELVFKFSWGIPPDPLVRSMHSHALYGTLSFLIIFDNKDSVALVSMLFCT